MPEPIAVMERYELKYLLDEAQTDFLVTELRNRMAPDPFGRGPVASLYYDTPGYLLIRASLEKPAFKEKIRLRSYGLANRESPVFLELKRKAHGIVCKRRMQSTLPVAEKFLAGSGDLSALSQIGREITRFRDHYGTLIPACLIICDREAFCEPGGGLRLTIDHRPRYRTDHLNLTLSMEGTALRPDGHTILEIKLQEAMPLWLAHILDEGRIYQTGFSKYGEAFRQLMAARSVRSLSP